MCPRASSLRTISFRGRRRRVQFYDRCSLAAPRGPFRRSRHTARDHSGDIQGSAETKAHRSCSCGVAPVSRICCRCGPRTSWHGSAGGHPRVLSVPMVSRGTGTWGGDPERPLVTDGWRWCALLAEETIKKPDNEPFAAIDCDSTHTHSGPISTATTPRKASPRAL